MKLDDKKKIITCVIGLILLVLGIIFINLIFKKEDNKNNVEKKEEKIELIDNLSFEVNSEIKVEDIISKDNRYKVLNSDDVISTNKIGDIEVKILYEIESEEKEFKCTIKVVDTIAPIIEYDEEVVTNQDENINLFKHVSVSDNSLEEIDVKVEGEYGFNKPGTYKLEYVAEDSSGNVTRRDFTLVVKEKKVTKPSAKPSSNNGVIGKTSKGFDIKKINGVFYIDEILIVNKTYALPKNFVPKNTYESAVDVKTNCQTCIDKEAYNSWLKMKDDAASLGLGICIQSGYRPYNLQKSLYNNYVERDGKKAADTYSARAGHSDHQTGLAFDLNSINDDFTKTKEAKWVNDNAYKYGFILRFPQGKEKYTGYKYESWHLRYVGNELAEKLYNNGDWISLEEYFGITSKYSD